MHADSQALIASDLALESLAHALRGAAALSIDTEFLRERTYYAQLCLLQIAGAGIVTCIDTLAIPTLAPLSSAFADASVCKVLHAARQDLEVLWPHTGPVRGIFDTQVAAALVGLPAQVGYADLVARLLGVTLAKTATRTDWSRRPLSPGQLSYALDDVRYLLPLRERLSAELDGLGRRPWFEAEMQALDTVTSYETQPAEAWRRLKGLSGLDPWRLGLAQALGAWREQRAMRADVPRGWVLPDGALRDLVLRVPRSTAQLALTAELPEGIRNRSGEALLALIESMHPPALLAPLPARERPDPLQTERVRRLSQALRAVADELKLAPEILATRRDLERVAAGDRSAPPLQGWRGELLGAALEAAR